MRLLSRYLYGNVVESISVAGFTLTETAYDSGLRLPKHSHEWSYFCFVLTGGFTEVYGRRSRLCHPSTLVFHPSDETHSDQFHIRSRCFNVQMNAQWLERLREHRRTLNGPDDFRGGAMSYLAVRLYREFRDGDDFSPLVIEALVLEMMAEASRRSIRKESRTRPRWLEQARELLVEQSCERLALAAIAESVGVHPTHLAREFRKFYRCTVGEFMRRARVEIACRKLSASDAPLSEIASEVGFFDQSHFTRTFKARTGVSPKEYRSAFRPR